MVVLDTKQITEYRGHISEACKLLYQDKCDEFISIGGDFQCIHYEDRTFGERVRERTLRGLEHSEIRYIVVARPDNADKSCVYLASKNRMQDNVTHAAFFKTQEDAETAMKKIRKQDGYTYWVEEYLYRLGNSCRLRIYYTMQGLKTDYGVLQFIREQVENRYLDERLDNRGKAYVWLDDLLIYKNQRIEFKAASGTAYTRVFNLKLLLHDGLIAFDSIFKFAKQYPEYNIPEVKYLTVNSTDQARRQFYDLGAVFYDDEKVQELACKELGLQAWL